MKYPQEQFKKLKEIVTVLNELFEVKQMHPSKTHYLVFQQVSEVQREIFIVYTANLR